MKSMFNLDSPLNKGLTLVADLMLVNFLFLLFLWNGNTFLDKNYKVCL